MTTNTITTTYGATLALPADFGHFWDFSNTTGNINQHAAQHERKVGTTADTWAALAYPTHAVKGNKSATGYALWLVDDNHPDKLTAVVMLHTATGKLTMPTVPFNWTKGFSYKTGRTYGGHDNPNIYTAGDLQITHPLTLIDTLKRYNA